jgi:hypothetical protein
VGHLLKNSRGPQAPSPARDTHVAQPPSSRLCSFNLLEWESRGRIRCLQLNTKAKSQRLRANGQWQFLCGLIASNFGFLAISSRTPATYPDDGIQSRSAAFPTLQVIGGRGSWGPNGRSQSTGVQAVSGFPTNQAFILWLLIRRRRSRQIQPQYRIEKKLLSIDKSLYQRLITRGFCKPRLIMCPARFVDP